MLNVPPYWFLSLLLALATIRAQDPIDPLLGKFANDELSILVENADGAYNGTITMEGESYRFAARKQEPGAMRGTFQDGEDKFEFTAKVEGASLLIKTGDARYTLRRESEKRNPLDRKGTRGVSAATPLNKTEVEPASGDADWKVFKHPFGLTLRYPADWRVQEAPDGSGYLLLPPGVVPGAEEVYLVGGQPSGDIASAEDPRLAFAAEQLMAGIGPLLQRVGLVEKIRAAGTPGIALAWESASGARARMFVTILKGQAIGITGLGLKEKVTKREPVIQKIFQTLSAGEQAQDPRVAGTWKRLGTTSLDARDNAGRLQASSAGDHQQTLQLRADGTCTSREVSRTIALGQGVSIDTGDQVTTKTGRWYAGEGKLGLLWDNAEPQEYTYEASGALGSRQLVFKLDNGRALLWAEGR